MIELSEKGFRVPVRAWLPREEIEPGAMDQLRNAARHPDAAVALAVMPDCHVGFGVTIGCVMPTANSVIPNAVGVDIGCGMCAVDTGVELDRERMGKEFWRGWMGNVQRNVPTGFAAHKTAQAWEGLDRRLRAKGLQPLLHDKAAVQLGTLGGGNHFLEAQVDERGVIWLMVHSGSRHTGLRIADHYHKLATARDEKRVGRTPRDLASLRLDDGAGQDYLHDMTWATDFALESRRRMIAGMVAALETQLKQDISQETFLNIHHNFASEEEHDSRRVVVHRKGATSARDGELGIIPGSMGTPSYIVRGRGNPLSLESCSHGAGRRMSRGQAKKEISERAFAGSIAGTFSKPSMGYVDEAPPAYKDIETVIGRQVDLIDVVHTLRPLATVKGDSKARED
ncbi:MAG: RNA-2',3'-PO4:RNA-5'-OH ligase [uncultured Thermomicrobiales bacterium]|uniref:3'-phosphate/5'-hydroxy nucleic acid ligase n=1 Tax=uncultured Thermomicrobiales bacterium TaxID=1645740 RepID=A0A6J4UU38_9BACT|nr:MAG: RNA-2',3'-PO4:RNA-5'-OH ligase [uncultured Thermomicrobiales bacterium]